MYGEPMMTRPEAFERIHRVLAATRRRLRLAASVSGLAWLVTGVGASLWLAVVVGAAEYFVNSERAFISVYNAMSDAKDRRRSDLVGTYTGQLAELVNTTSYTRARGSVLLSEFACTTRARAASM